MLPPRINAQLRRAGLFARLAREEVADDRRSAKEQMITGQVIRNCVRIHSGVEANLGYPARSAGLFPLYPCARISLIRVASISMVNGFVSAHAATGIADTRAHVLSGL
jgi:hypothetical protein